MEFVDRFAEALAKASGGEITLTREEVVAVLALAREVAHRTDDRTNAPVAAYLAGKFAAGRDGEGALADAITVSEDLLPPASA